MANPSPPSVSVSTDPPFRAYLTVRPQGSEARVQFPCSESWHGVSAAGTP